MPTTYLYRAVDSGGQTIDFLISAKRDAVAAKRFFREAQGQPHTVNPRTNAFDRNAAYPKAAESHVKCRSPSMMAIRSSGCPRFNAARHRRGYVVNLNFSDNTNSSHMVRRLVRFMSTIHRARTPRRVA